MLKILISYRREESAAVAGRLSDRLVQAFGRKNVFLDVDTIEAGADFVKTIERALRDIDVLVVVIGRRWTTMTDEGGKRRLDKLDDYVRLEVVTALKRDIRVVPVLIDGASMPSADELPTDLASLAERNAFALSDVSFHADVTRLIENLQRRRIYSIVHPLVLSFYSQLFYRDVAQNWSGRGALYLTLLLALAWIPFLWESQGEIERFVQNEGRWLAGQLPRITVTDGVASTDAKTPYFIRGPEGRIYAIIDMTGQFTPVAFEQTGAIMLLTRTQLATRESRGAKVEDLSLLGDFWIDGPRLERWLQFAEKWLVFVAYPVCVLVSLIYRVILAHIFGAVGLFFARTLNLRMRYIPLVRLSAIGMTPAVLLETVREFFELGVPMRGLFGLAITAAYLFYAVRANTRVKTVI